LLGVRIADSLEATAYEPRVALDPGQHPVVREDVGDAAELAREGLGIAKERLLREGDAPTVAGSTRNARSRSCGTAPA
jgi:hypothetical protein